MYNEKPKLFIAFLALVTTAQRLFNQDIPEPATKTQDDTGREREWKYVCRTVQQRELRKFSIWNIKKNKRTGQKIMSSK